MKHNVVLIGFMGCGKTTVGKVLSKKMELGFADSDQMIEEKEAMTIPDIFEKYGEKYFRKLEEETILSLLEKDNMIISTGGGAVLNSSLFEYIKNNAKVVHLDASIDTLWDRLKNCTNRPMLYSDNPRKRMEELYQKRLPLYKKAHYNIRTDGKNPEQIAMEIMLCLEVY